ncbi:hypothetical protein [Roseofilum casamattae]|uniref:Uncharacterized protein n=1 Tax=Roseofilum casamattae BLCC-M143 TaxID=3022442 RepID=A0ABT7BTT5_9CYAN|nr:hypothetical protein [Roseofilum casamattae]MDJ1182593.1 hypothetical protein [Roseofilum casamattae BLCC-M143]
MTHPNCQTSACRYCRHFIPEGRRGGNCEQLGVPVRGSWKACSLALPAFAPSWENLEGANWWPSQTLTAIATVSQGSTDLDDLLVNESKPKLSVVEDDRDRDLALA